MTKVQGLDKLKIKLAAFSPAIQKKLATAVLKSAQEVADSARNLAPVGRTGKLKASIQAVMGDVPHEEGGQKVFGSTGAREDNSVIKATVYAGDRDAWYARLVEFGVAPHEAGGKFEGAQHPGTTAQPFFFPAYRSRRKSAKTRITRAIREAVKEVASKK